jgi:hypothetical protein
LGFLCSQLLGPCAQGKSTHVAGMVRGRRRSNKVAVGHRAGGAVLARGKRAVPWRCEVTRLEQVEHTAKDDQGAPADSPLVDGGGCVCIGSNSKAALRALDLPISRSRHHPAIEIPALACMPHSCAMSPMSLGHRRLAHTPLGLAARVHEGAHGARHPSLEMCS